MTERPAPTLTRPHGPLPLEVESHLRHTTDGHWHDDCDWCLRRRRYGRTGHPYLDAPPAPIQEATC